MKTFKYISAIILILLTGTIFAQQNICSDFNTGTDGWTPLLASQNISNPALDGTDYLRVRDGSGASWTYNTTSYPKVWTELQGNCLCFDYKVFNDAQSGVANLHPKITIFQGTTPNAGGIRATFIATNITITENSDWVHVCAPIELCSGSSLPSNAMGAWVMSPSYDCTDWNNLLANVDGISFWVDVAGSGAQNEIIGVDNVCIQECDIQEPPTNEGAYCCPSGEKNPNLVNNGNFEAGDTGFYSNYTQTATTYPGEYDVTTSAAVFGANVNDQSNCVDPSLYATNNTFMVVNGKTQQSGFNVIWEQSVSGLEPDKEYKLCANFKDMEQCTFNILPKIRLSAGTYSTIEVINTDDTNPCDWQKVEICFTAVSQTMNIKIELDESGNGDGNDLAIDDIAVQQKLDPNYFITVQHQGNGNQISASLNTMATTDDILLNGICKLQDKYYWFIYETTSPTSPLWGSMVPGTFAWSSNASYSGPGVTGTWGLTTNFPNYSFANNKFYIIGMYVPSCCESCYTDGWAYQVTYNFGRSAQSGELDIETKEEIIRHFVDLKEETPSDHLIKNLRVYPNPSSSRININTDFNKVDSYIISDSMGNILLSNTDKNFIESIDITSLKQGIYILTVTENNNKKSTTFIKK